MEKESYNKNYHIFQLVSLQADD